jgi:hypothetical protein
MMIRSLITTLAFLFYFSASAQMSISNKTKASPLDQSPLDMAYYPSDYTVLKSQDKMKDPPVARVIFSRPQKNKRVIFGELIEYGVVWRLGANEATELEFFKDVKMGGKKIAKGRYTIYAIPQATEWTIIINKDTDVWGAFKYDPKKDVARINVPVTKTTDTVEVFTMGFAKNGNGVTLNIAWDDTAVSVPFTY